MPELPEVETVRQGLEKTITGRRIVRVEQRRPDLRVPFPEKLSEKLTGRDIVICRRRAKYLLIELGSGDNLVIHLGMSGRIKLFSPQEEFKPERHDHFILSFDDDSKMVFSDPRRFGMVLLVPGQFLGDHKAFKNIGPEPLDNGFSGPVLHDALKGKSCTIKAALLDQRVVAGLGNIYVCEALYDSGISPLRKAGKVNKAECEKLVVAIRDVLTRAIASGGSSLRDYRKTSGELGYFQHHFKVYDREGVACPDCDCDIGKTGGIKRIVQSGRSSFYCPRRQK